MTSAGVPTIEQFGRDLRAGRTTAEQITEACLAQCAARGDLNAFILVMADQARQQARAMDREMAAGRDRGPLHGVPVSIKDLVDIAGAPTTAASRVREGHVAAADAPIITALREAGAVLIGKTNLHEFAFGTTNEESAFGPARNPYDPARSPGGSSGGSAVSVAAGMALATVGTDTGGSIRIPSAACGIVGLKPRLGEVSTEGVVPLSRRMDHVGPLARTVADACLVYDALMGVAGRSVPEARDLRGLKLAVPRVYFCDLLDAEVRARFESALDAFRRAGAVIEDVVVPHAHLTAAVYLHIVLSDAAAYHAQTLETMPERYTVPVRIRLEMGRYVLAEDYVRALDGREALGRDVNAALAGHDALVLPTLAIPAPRIGVPMVDIEGVQEPVRNVMLRLTQAFNLTGHPAIAIPNGLTRDGLPCSLQLVGTETRALVGVARACEARLGLASGG